MKGKIFLAALCALLSLAEVLGILAPSFGMQQRASASS